MKKARLLKFKLIAPTNYNAKRLSVKCPRYDHWKLFMWRKEIDNNLHDQVDYILLNSYGFRKDEIICYSVNDKDCDVMITNFDRRIEKRKNH